MGRKSKVTEQKLKLELEKAKGKTRVAAGALGVSYHTVNNLVLKYNLSDFRAELAGTLITKEMLIDAIDGSGGLMTVIAGKLGRDYRTVLKCIGRHDLMEYLNDEEQKRLDFTESKLMENIGDNDQASIFFFLKTKGKARGYSEHYVKPEQTSQVVDYNAMTTDELIKRAEAIKTIEESNG